MLVERRVIVFTRADLLDAVRRYGERLGKQLPDTAPEALVFDPGTDQALCLRFTKADPGNPARPDFVFSSEQVGAAMIAYCRDHHVPLPKDSVKQIEKHRDGAALMIHNTAVGLHVMIIDDQEAMRTIVRKLLVRANVQQVTEATDGIQALRMLAKGAEVDPDVIICDLHMDKMDGVDFLKHLRADKSSLHCRKPVLILTSDRTDRVLDITHQVGASKLLIKPISADDLATEIRRVMGYVD